MSAALFGPKFQWLVSSRFIPFRPSGSSHHGTATGQPLKGWLSFGIVWRSCLDCIFGESFCYKFWVWAQLVQDSALFRLQGPGLLYWLRRVCHLFACAQTDSRGFWHVPGRTLVSWHCQERMSGRDRRAPTSQESGGQTATMPWPSTVLLHPLSKHCLETFGASRDYINLWLFDYKPFNVVQLRFHSMDLVGEHPAFQTFLLTKLDHTLARKNDAPTPNRKMHLTCDGVILKSVWEWQRQFVCFCVCIFVCVFLCLCFRVFVFVCLFVFFCGFVFVFLCFCVCVFMFVCLCLCFCVCVFSRMRSEGFPFIVGVWGWTCVRVVFVVSSSSGLRRVLVGASSGR